MLSVLIWIPLLAALLIVLWPNLSPQLSRQISLLTAGGLLVWSLILARLFDPTVADLQMVEHITWIQPLGLNYYLGVDGLSLPLVIINALLVAIAIWSSDLDISRPRLYYPLLLIIFAGVAGTFLSSNLLLFILFYEVELIPLYLLIAIWGGKNRGYAATKFLLYTAVSGLLILAAFLGIVWLTKAPDFDLDTLRTSTLGVSALPLTTQLILLGGLVIGFGIKIPVVPFHTWLPDAHVEASTPVSVLLAGVLLKLGTYGLLRFGVGLFPDAWNAIAPYVASWAVVSVLYGASCAISQKDIKKMVAYSSIAHMGYIILAFAAASPISLLGSVMQMVSHGLISALLFLTVGVVYKKSGSRDIDVIRGLLNPERGLPLIGSIMIVAVMASAGIPGLVGFVSEFLVFRGSMEVFPVQTLLCMVGTGLTSVYFLIMINRAFFGRLSESVINLPRVQWRDRIPAIALAVIITFLGLQPTILVKWTESTTSALMYKPPIVAQIESNVKAIGLN
ncbi:MAG: NADH-quinone oxidoreductase subunit M [Limnospira sp. PMC 894.15]|uniref:NADH-quinone oxidoreductase subunit M n=1 Tax=unclassified Limnospira TaxID=2642885 RepID=UPI0028E0DA1F|nr:MULTISPECIES: NADH-quinone oxidoreductase subunit M [unclassified Limnospira]MDT9187370.1 NADH-quinone oxidoreductase subunit M [Limnospira sp. PMC 894.15]MDT9233381.1 NADH-quinone oxidoreductase subunit M [Limnospira sp. PMC 917.15]